MAEQERKALTREQILAQELEEFDLPDFDLHLVEMRALDMDAAMADADDEALSDRDFAARAVARRVTPATTADEVTAWPDEKILAALGILFRTAGVLSHEDAVTFVSVRDAVRAENRRLLEMVNRITGPLRANTLEAMNASVTVAQRAVEETRALGRMLEVQRQAAFGQAQASITREGEPEQDAEERLANATAAEINRITEAQVAVVALASDQQQVIEILNKGIGDLTSGQQTTNDELRQIREGSAPKWMTYAAFILSIIATVATVVGIFVMQGPSNAGAAPQPSPTAIVSAAPSLTSAPPTPTPSVAPTPSPATPSPAESASAVPTTSPAP